MKKSVILGSIVLAASLLTACGPMNTRFRPYVKEQQKVEGLHAIVTRGDRTGVYLALKNETAQDMEIVWSETKLAGDEISHGTYIDKNDHNVKLVNTVLKPGEIHQSVIHRQSDMYYLDPVLYQPGGVKIHPLRYPVTLELKVKQGDKYSTVVLDIFRDESLYQKDVDARVEDDFIKEFKVGESEERIQEINEDVHNLRNEKKVIKRVNKS